MTRLKHFLTAWLVVIVVGGLTALGVCGLLDLVCATMGPVGIPILILLVLSGALAWMLTDASCA